MRPPLVFRRGCCSSPTTTMHEYIHSILLVPMLHRSRYKMLSPATEVWEKEVCLSKCFFLHSVLNLKNCFSSYLKTIKPPLSNTRKLTSLPITYSPKYTFYLFRHIPLSTHYSFHLYQKPVPTCSKAPK